MSHNLKDFRNILLRNSKTKFIRLVSDWILLSIFNIEGAGPFMFKVVDGVFLTLDLLADRYYDVFLDQISDDDLRTDDQYLVL